MSQKQLSRLERIAFKIDAMIATGTDVETWRRKKSKLVMIAMTWGYMIL